MEYLIYKGFYNALDFTTAMPANYTILDCYTDEPAGLGVPPYLGTYPRYIAGSIAKNTGELPNYITIDDLRLLVHYKAKLPKEQMKTNIYIYNTTRSSEKIQQILNSTDELIIILGVHTPGKYLSAIPGTLRELTVLLKDINCRKILTGPAVFGTQLEGGKRTERIREGIFDEVRDYNFSYEQIAEFAVKGAEIIKQIPALRIIEIETGKGCQRAPGCSFCTEPIKNKFENRKLNDVLNEIKEFHKLGQRRFRIGKQSCFYAYPDCIELLKKTSELGDIKVLHIDNVNPMNVVTKRGEEITKAVVKYCTAGNVAAFGVESFDERVITENNLNTNPEMVYKAIRLLNKYGAERGENGMPKFLPGINILFGLKGETKETFEKNYFWLKKILDDGLLLRRINIRQVVAFPGTRLYEECGDKYIKKNKKYYWKWRHKIREDIDNQMLKRLAPEGTILSDLFTEIHDGKTTFARQFGTYPLIIGLKGRHELKQFVNAKVSGYMLRSVMGEVV